MFALTPYPRRRGHFIPSFVGGDTRCPQTSTLGSLLCRPQLGPACPFPSTRPRGPTVPNLPSLPGAPQAPGSPGPGRRTGPRADAWRHRGTGHLHKTGRDPVSLFGRTPSPPPPCWGGAPGGSSLPPRPTVGRRGGRAQPGVSEKFVGHKFTPTPRLPKPWGTRIPIMPGEFWHVSPTKERRLEPTFLSSNSALLPRA